MYIHQGSSLGEALRLITTGKRKREEKGERGGRRKEDMEIIPWKIIL